MLGADPRLKSKMLGKSEKLTTVQGVGNPVPAAFGSGQAGSQPSSSSNRNVPAVENLAVGALNTTSTRTQEAEKVVALNVAINDKEAFVRSNRLARSPVKESQPSMASLPLLDLEPEQKAGSESNDNVIDQRLKKLKSHIEGLQSYVKDRHNVHQEIKRMLRLIKTSFGDLEMEIRCASTGAEEIPQVKAPHNWTLKPQAGGILVENTFPEIMTPTRPTAQSCAGGDSVKRRRVKEDPSGRTPEQKKKGRC